MNWTLSVPGTHSVWRNSWIQQRLNTEGLEEREGKGKGVEGRGKGKACSDLEKKWSESGKQASKELNTLPRPEDNQRWLELPLHPQWPPQCFPAPLPSQLPALGDKVLGDLKTREDKHRVPAGLSLMRASKSRRRQQEENVVWGADEHSQKVTDQEGLGDALSPHLSVGEMVFKLG